MKEAYVHDVYVGITVYVFMYVCMHACVHACMMYVFIWACQDFRYLFFLSAPSCELHVTKSQAFMPRPKQFHSIFAVISSFFLSASYEDTISTECTIRVRV